MTKITWILGLVIATNVLGQIMFKIAANAVKEQDNIYLMAFSLIRVPAIWAALFLYFTTTLLWVWVLREMPLSIAYSALSLVFVLVAFSGILFFKEPISMNLLFGIFLISAGIYTIFIK